MLLELLCEEPEADEEVVELVVAEEDCAVEEPAVSVVVIALDSENSASDVEVLFFKELLFFEDDWDKEAVSLALPVSSVVSFEDSSEASF